MATVIRSPKISESPRKLYSDARPVAAPDTTGVPTDNRKAPAVEVEAVVEPVVSGYEPPISEAEVRELQLRSEHAERRAQQAETALAELQAQIEQRRADATEQGYADGYEEARKNVDIEFQQRLYAVEQLISGINEELEKLVAQAEDVIVETVYAATIKVIGKQLAEPEGIATVVRHVARQLIRPDNVVVKLSPPDYALLEECKVELVNSTGGQAIRIVADPAIDCGGCVLESAGGSLDARLETQLRRLQEVLLNSRAQRQQELEGRSDQ